MHDGCSTGAGARARQGTVEDAAHTRAARQEGSAAAAQQPGAAAEEKF